MVECPETLQCRKCLNFKSISELVKDRNKKFGVRNLCLLCIKLINKEAYDSASEYLGEIPETIICVTCSNSLSNKEFSKKPLGKFGLQSQCKKCVSNEMKNILSKKSKEIYSENQTKVCSQCLKDLLLENFHKNKAGKFGRHSKCKNCYK